MLSENIANDTIVNNIEHIISISESQEIEIMILYAYNAQDVEEIRTIYGQGKYIDINYIDFTRVDGMFHTHPYSVLSKSYTFRPDRSINWIKHHSSIDNSKYDFDAIRCGLFPSYSDINCAVYNNIMNIIIGNKFGIIMYEIDNSLELDDMQMANNLERKMYEFRRHASMYNMCMDYILMRDKLHYDLSYRYVSGHKWIKKI